MLSIPPGLRRRAPRLSIVLVVYRMSAQADKTLLSLSPGYQRGVAARDYEVVVVENSSADELGPASAGRHAGNVRYYRRRERGRSPVPAANFGARKCRGEMLAMMIDGARMASPGLVRALLDAGRLGADTVVAVPGYHLGDRLQQEALRHGYDEAREARLLASIGWPADGYRLFNIACLSGSCRDGPLLPFAESNCLAMHRPLWRALGGIDPRFTETGGGQANLDLYKRACEWPGTELVIAHGEGTFHQFHGGVTTGTRGAERERHMRNHSEQYRRLRGEHFSKPARRGRLFGRLHPSAARFLELSIEVAQRQGAAP